jgi:hypothetical protein
MRWAVKTISNWPVIYVLGNHELYRQNHKSNLACSALPILRLMILPGHDSVELQGL